MINEEPYIVSTKVHVTEMLYHIFKESDVLPLDI